MSCPDPHREGPSGAGSLARIDGSKGIMRRIHGASPGLAVTVTFVLSLRILCGAELIPDAQVQTPWGPNTDLPAIAGQMMVQRGLGKLRRQCDAWSERMRARRWLGHANEEA